MSYPQIKKCKCLDKTIQNLYYTPFVDMISLAFHFETWQSFFSYFYEPSCAHLFVSIPWDLHVSLSFSFSSWTLMCPNCFSILLHSTCLLNHILRERDHYLQNLEYLFLRHVFVYSQCRSRYFGGWRHVLAYSQCRNSLCMWVYGILILGA